MQYYWQYDIPTKATYKVSSRFRSPSFTVTRGMISFMLVSETRGERLTKQMIDFFSRITILIVRKFQNVLIVLNYIGMQSHLWPQLWAPFPPTSLQSEDFGFWGISVVILTLSVAYSWLLIVQLCQEKICKLQSSRFSNPCFPVTTNLMSCFKVSIKRFLLELEDLINKSLILYPSVEFWRTTTARNCFKSWHTSVLTLVFLQLHLHFFHQGVNVDGFTPEASCSFLSISKYDIYIGIGILIGQRLQKFFQFR